MIREDNQALDKSYRYVYNSVGSLTSVETYAYTTAALVTPQSTVSFGCTNERLTSFSGATISYDTMGQPTTYEGKTATWSKGRLSKLSQGTLATGLRNYTYSYNAFGQRVSRNYTYAKELSPDQTVVSGELLQAAHRYSYDHFGRLIRETCTRNYRGEGSQTETMVFLYDETGVIGMEYALDGSGGIYYFRRNPQGDVVGIYDMSGVRVASYVYDAWGNCTIGSGTTNTAVANANPFRYRGYYYDSDTGLYFCNARYYSPKWRRFISPDDTSYIDPEAVNGLNLYAYCGNDPVNYADPSGHFSILAFAISVGVSLAFELLDDALDGGLFDGSHDWKDYLGAGISGALGGLGGGLVAQTGLALAGGFADAALSGDLKDDGFWNTMDGILFSSLLSFGIGEVTHRLASGVKASSLKKLTNNVANRKLKAMGATIKIGSHAAKTKGGLSKAIREQSKWVGNVIYGDLVGAVSGGLTAIGHGYVRNAWWWNC